MSDKISNADDISVEINPYVGEPFTIDNWTSYSFDCDFFTPSDGFSLEIADDRVDQIVNKISLGDSIALKVNNTTQCEGYMESINLDYSRTGTSLQISGRDKMGIVCDATTTPDMQISATDTYLTAILKILEPFGYDKSSIIGIEDVVKEADLIKLNSKRVQGKGIPHKSSRLSARALSAKTNHKIKPNKNEGYMEYLKRLGKRSGWQIKLYPDGKHIWIGPPIYDRDATSSFKLVHKFDQTNNENNILSGNLNIDWSQQPSYIIGEGNSSGGKHRKNISNIVMANDITTYKNKTILADIKTKISKLKSYGFKSIDMNSKLIDALPKLARINYNNKQALLRENFIYDEESKSLDELEFFVRMKMAEFNNKFFTLKYVVDGHTNNGAIWQVNSMCRVIDDTYGIDGNYWIKQRTFTKDRSGGTKTQLVLGLPYVFSF